MFNFGHCCCTFFLFSIGGIFPSCLVRVLPLGVLPLIVLPLGVSLLGVFSVSQKCTNQHSVYQSAYSDTPMLKSFLEASRTNWRTLVHPCQNDPWRHDVPICREKQRFPIGFEITATKSLQKRRANFLHFSGI